MRDAETSPRTYRVEHTTLYRYSEDVSVSYGRAHLLPRSAPGQRVVSAVLDVDPGTDEQREHIDYFGNVSTYYAVRTPHRVLRVTARSEVAVERPATDIDALDAWAWEDVRDALADGVEARAFLLPSPSVAPAESVRSYAAATFTPRRPFGSALRELLARIHDDFEYESGSTTVNTKITEVMVNRHGVCQDFAHLSVGCLRSLGLPARYVSGYLETVPPPGKPKLQGADASHAWTGVMVPELGWLDLDPTNDQFVDNRYVAVGWGRDYTDVPPLKGVILTHAKKSTLDVSVDVVRTD